MMLDPKCLNEFQQQYGWSAKGYLLPCCWHDIKKEYQEEIKYLFNEKLHIENNNTIEDILNSEEWKRFYNTMNENKCCNVYCNVNSPTHIKVIS